VSIRPAIRSAFVRAGVGGDQPYIYLPSMTIEKVAAAGFVTARNNAINVPLLVGGTVERAALVPAIGTDRWYGCAAFEGSTSNGLEAASSAAEYGTAQRTIGTLVSGILGVQMPAEDTGFDAVALSLYTDANNQIRVRRATSTRVLSVDVITNGVVVGSCSISAVNDNVHLLFGFSVAEGVIKAYVDGQIFTEADAGIIPPVLTSHVRVLAAPGGDLNWFGAVDYLRIE